jgi:transposase-like protein
MNKEINCSIFPDASITAEAQGEFVKITITGRSGTQQSVILDDYKFSELLTILDEFCGY